MEPIIFNSIPQVIDLGNNIIVHCEIITHVTLPRDVVEDMLDDDELTHLKIGLPKEAFIVKAQHIAKAIRQRKTRKKKDRVVDLTARQNLEYMLRTTPVPGPTRKGFEK